MKIEVYDTTLRDGTQGELVSFTVGEKLQVATLLDRIGIDFIEGGWPGANPRDSEFFQKARTLSLRHARLAAFGSTAHPAHAPEDDANLRCLLDAETPVVTIFGKSWTLHVEQALGISLDENLKLIEASVAMLVRHGREVIFDAEHFFDGFNADPEYALRVLGAAEAGGASRLVLCDTNGGNLPTLIAEAVALAGTRISRTLGIHAHNDCDLGTANSIAAVAAGARHVQGTFNGWGERCGNADLCSVIPVLELKMGRTALGAENLRQLTPVARQIAELANLPHDHRLPFVGNSAFAHKGGIHVSAVRRNPATYEHVAPESVGNARRVLVSDLAGRSNLLYKTTALGLEGDLTPELLQEITSHIKRLENQGYEMESADGSLELLIRRRLGHVSDAFLPVAFTVQTRFISGEQNSGDRGGAAAGEPAAPDGAHDGADDGAHDGTVVDVQAQSEAQVTLNVDGKTVVATASARGPVAALDQALRRALFSRFPQLAAVVLTDYKVRILEGNRGTRAQVRVLVESSDGRRSWTTVGVSDNVIEASWEALTESLQFFIRSNSAHSAASLPLA